MEERAPLTYKQAEVYVKVKEYIEKNGNSPTIRTLCKMCGVSSTATMFVHLKKLKLKGYISIEPYKKEGIKIL